MKLKELYNNVIAKFNSGISQNKKEEIHNYFKLELIPNLKSDRDLFFLNQEAKKHSKILKPEMKFLLTELRKQYIIEVLKNNNLNPDLKAIVKKTKKSIANYEANLELSAKGLPIKNDIMAMDDAFLATIIKKELMLTGDRYKAELMKESANLIFDDILRKNTKHYLVVRFFRSFDREKE